MGTNLLSTPTCHRKFQNLAHTWKTCRCSKTCVPSSSSWDTSGELWSKGVKSILEGIQLNIRWVALYICDAFVFGLLPRPEIFLNKLLFLLSLRSFGIVGDKDSQDDINPLWSLQMWKKKRCICVSLWEVSDQVSTGNTRFDMVLDHNTKDNTEVNQKLRPLLQGKEGRMTPRYFGEMLNHHLRGFAQGKTF